MSEEYLIGFLTAIIIVLWIDIFRKIFKLIKMLRENKRLEEKTKNFFKDNEEDLDDKYD